MILYIQTQVACGVAVAAGGTSPLRGTWKASSRQEYPLPQDTCTEIQTEVKKPHRGGAWGQSGDAKSTLAYFFSSCICSLASCVAALCPAILTADMNGAAAAGGVTSPVN